MIYVDTSVVLAQLLAEDRCPPESLWATPLVSSRLTEYEVWTRIHARSLGRSHGPLVRELFARLSWLELTPVVLARALEPWPVAIRTLDALHLAALDFLRKHQQDIPLATYDARLATAADRLGIGLFPL
ncbi:MAG: PIN domain-containing protein [Acidobacteriota bacterium]|nr:PIN domain-containing protein [Acidobacteriota bacterium]